MFEYIKEMMTQLGFPLWMLGIFVIIMIWSNIWKLLALWKSARKNSFAWFIILALVNTFGILEILYIFVFSEIKHSKRTKTSTTKARKKKRR